jgi:hypothetical protein
MSELLADIGFTAEVIEWRGPAPFYFAVVPDVHVGELRYAARQASYGWGVVPVTAEVEGAEFTTSLFPRADGYLLPLKLAVRRATGIALGDPISVRLRVFAA